MQNKELTGYPSIDKPWLKYFPESAFELKPQECTVYRGIYDNNKEYPNDIALLFFGKKITYGKLFDEVEKCAKALKSIGIKEGDCVTLCTAGIPEAVYTVLACSKIGAIANFINPLFTTEQMIARINETNAEWIFILDEMYSYIEKALPNTCIKNAVIMPVYNSMQDAIKVALALKGKARKILKLKSPQKHMLWNDFVKLGEAFDCNTEIEYKKDTPVIMVYSSGTTGASKGILLTNESANAVIATYRNSSFVFERGYTFLQMIPIWFSTGIVLSIIMPLCMGVTVIPEPLFSKETFLKDLIKYKPSMTVTATSLWLYVMEHDSQKIDFTNMQYPTAGGEKVLPQDEKLLNEFLKKRGCKKKLYKGYGMCELGSEVTGSTDAKGYNDKPGGNGYPMRGVIVSAFDINTNKELKYGEHGEIRVNSPGRMKEYYKNEKATAEFFHTDENGLVWGCTGDIGYVDEDGELFILGRATDNTVLDSGKKIYLFDIEEIILQNKAVSGCKVVAVKNNGKTILAAHMTLKDNSIDKEKLAGELHDLCSKQLSAEEVPHMYKFRESFPVHSNGKRDNGALAAETNGFIVIE